MTSWLNSHLVVVDAGVEVVAAPRDLRVDEPAPVRVIQLAVGHAHLRNLCKLPSRRPHVREVLVEAPGGGQRPRRRPRVVIAEPVGRDDIVVNHRAVRPERVGCRCERDQPAVGPDRRDGEVGWIVDCDPAIHRDVAMPPNTTSSANRVIATLAPPLAKVVTCAGR